MKATFGKPEGEQKLQTIMQAHNTHSIEPLTWYRFKRNNKWGYIMQVQSSLLIVNDFSENGVPQIQHTDFTGAWVDEAFLIGPANDVVVKLENGK